MSFTKSWICSVCCEGLQEVELSRLTCSSGHSFDLAHEGYVNFLVGRQKTGPKGDALEMLMARRRHFEEGFYEPLRENIIEYVKGVRHYRVLEVGCGEGYYIGGVSDRISSSRCFGTDIAKEGIKLASKKYKKAGFAVADTNQLLPVADNSVDVLLNIFAPRNPEEFIRIMRPGGRLLVVIPTSRHMVELRDFHPLLAIEEDKRRAVEERLKDFFTLQNTDTVTAPLLLGGTALLDLIRMTPNARFLSSEQEEALETLADVHITAEFELLDFHVNS